MQQIFLHTRDHASMSLYHTVINVMLESSESHAAGILNMAMLGFHYLQLYRWETALLHFSPDAILRQLCYTTNIWQGGWWTSQWKQFFFGVTRGSDGMQLTHKVSQNHAVFAITPSTPQDVKCLQKSDLFSGTAHNPQHLSTSRSQHVKNIQTKTVCITASDLNNLLPVFWKASLFKWQHTRFSVYNPQFYWLFMTSSFTLCI